MNVESPLPTTGLKVRSSALAHINEKAERGRDLSKATQNLHNRDGFNIGLVPGLVSTWETRISICNRYITTCLDVHDLTGCVLVTCQLSIIIPVFQMRKLKCIGNVPASSDRKHVTYFVGSREESLIK